MTLLSKIQKGLQLAGSFLRQPRTSLRLLRQLPAAVRGVTYGCHWPDPPAQEPSAASGDANPFRAFFNARTQGRGIWKWDHYFDAYERHLARFRGRSPHVLEIGVYSGGSLDLWRHAFGPDCHLYGVDIEPACRAYQDERTRIFVGDQADRAFWQRFKKEVPTLDIVIDDGGHERDQQIATLEELLPHLRPGGVYFCEDIHGRFNEFAAYVQGLANHLNTLELLPSPAPPAGAPPGTAARATAFQQSVLSVHFYPFLVVIERASSPVRELIAPRHGTEWQPFL